MEHTVTLVKEFVFARTMQHAIQKMDDVNANLDTEDNIVEKSVKKVIMVISVHKYVCVKRINLVITLLANVLAQPVQLAKDVNRLVQMGNLERAVKKTVVVYQINDAIQSAVNASANQDSTALIAKKYAVMEHLV